MQTASSSRLRIGAAVATGMLGFLFGFGGLASAGQADHATKKDNGGAAATSDAAPGSADRTVEAGGSGTQGSSMSNPDGAPGVDKPYAADGYDAETQGDTVDSDGNNGCGNDADFADDNNGNCGGLHKGHDRTAESPAVSGTEADHDQERCPKASTMGQENGQGEGVTKHCGSAAPAAVSAEHLSASAAAPAARAVPAVEAETVTAVATAPGAVGGEALAASLPASVLGTALERQPAQVLGETIERGAAGGSTPAAGAAVLGTSITRGALAFTGSSALLLALIGFTLIAIGVAAKRVGERRTA